MLLLLHETDEKTNIRMYLIESYLLLIDQKAKNTIITALLNMKLSIFSIVPILFLDSAISERPANHVSFLRSEETLQSDDIKFWKRFLSNDSISFSSEPAVLDPSVEPSATPFTDPSVRPSTLPSHLPSNSPTIEPSTVPTSTPSISPNATPSTKPSTFPSGHPSLKPSVAPSTTPTNAPTATPSSLPTALPSQSPFAAPSTAPTIEPSNEPSTLPTDSPTTSPSVFPSASPTTMPSTYPIASPSTSPSSEPTTTPSDAPTASPVQPPVAKTTILPTIMDPSVTNPGTNECTDVQIEIGCYQMENGKSCDYIPLQNGLCTASSQALTFQYNPSPCQTQTESCEDFGNLSTGLIGNIRCTDTFSTELQVKPSAVRPGTTFSVTNSGKSIPSIVQCLVTNTPDDDAQTISINVSNVLDVIGSLKLVSCNDVSCLREIHHQIKIANVGNTELEVTNITVSSTHDNTQSAQLVPDYPIVAENFVTFERSSFINVCQVGTYLMEVKVESNSFSGSNSKCAAQNNSTIMIAPEYMISTMPSEFPSNVPSSIPSSEDVQIRAPTSSGKGGKSGKGGGKGGKSGKGGNTGKGGGKAERVPSSSVVQAPNTSSSNKSSSSSTNSGKGHPSTPTNASVSGGSTSGKGLAPSSVSVIIIPSSGKGAPLSPSNASVNLEPSSGPHQVLLSPVADTSTNTVSSPSHGKGNVMTPNAFP